MQVSSQKELQQEILSIVSNFGKIIPSDYQIIQAKTGYALSSIAKKISRMLEDGELTEAQVIFFGGKEEKRLANV